MVRCEGDGDEDNILVALFDVLYDGVLGLRAKPGGGTDLGLPAEAVGVAERQTLHYRVDGRGDFSRVWVTCKQ